MAATIRSTGNPNSPWEAFDHLYRSLGGFASYEEAAGACVAAELTPCGWDVVDTSVASGDSPSKVRSLAHPVWGGVTLYAMADGSCRYAVELPAAPPAHMVDPEVIMFPPDTVRH